MRAYGYVRGDEDAEAPIELREVSLLCSVEDLRRLRAFISAVIDERSADGSIDKEPWHDHLRDRDQAWTEDEADIILCFGPP
jgi:hypothetical protein